MSELPPLDERCRELTADLGSEEGDSDVMVRLILDCRHRQLSVALEHLREVDDFLIGWDMAAGDKGYKAALHDYVTMELKAHDDPAVSAVAAERERELSGKNARIVELDKACLLEEEAKSYYRNLLYGAETKLAESSARIAEMERRDLEAVTNCDKLKVARETRKHWQERAESAEAKLRSVSEVLKEIPVVAQYEFHEGWLECYSIASVDFFVARLRAIVEEGK